jgi:hypothetical protein
VTVYVLLKLLHVLFGFWLVSGLLGRWIAGGRAARAGSIVEMRPLIDLVGRFDTLMVIPGSFLVLGLGIVTAWAGGWPLFGFLQGSTTNWLLLSLLLALSLFALVPTVFLPRGKVFGAALDDATAKGEITPELLAAFHDPVVRAAHWYELGAVVVILVLMVAKPF